MNLTRDEIIDLLSIVQAYDGRTIGESDLQVYGEQARRSRWTFDEAREAIHAHHAASSAFLMPAHITHHVRARRSHPPPTSHHDDAKPELDRAPQANPEHVAQTISALAQRLGWRSRTTTGNHDMAAMRVECPHCLAAPKVMCSRTITRGHHSGERQPLRQFHASRVDAGRAVEAA